MIINKDNYEAYFLDYFEGNLTSHDMTEVLNFVELHPEVKSEFEGFEVVSLLPDERIKFEGKGSLKKNEFNTITPITISNIDEYLISDIEGVLSENEKLHLEEFISANPVFDRDRRIFSHTRLQPDLSIGYSAKEGLIHKAITYHEINEFNFEEYLIAELEGCLSSREINDLYQFILLNPHLAEERKFIGLTRIQPDTSLIYEAKSSLKHFVLPIRRVVLYALSAAASIVLLFSVYFIWQNYPEPNRVAVNTGKLQVNPTINHSKTMSPKVKIIKPTFKVSASKTLAKNNPDQSFSGHVIPGEMIMGKLPRNLDPMPTMDAIACKEVKSRDFVEPEFLFIRTSQMHSNEYMELYYNVKLAEQIQYAQINKSDKNPERTILSAFTSRIRGLLNQKNKNVTEDDQSGLSVWTFAELGVKTYNSIARDDVKLDLERNEQGKVVAYNLNGDKLHLQRDIDK